MKEFVRFLRRYVEVEQARAAANADDPFEVYQNALHLLHLGPCALTPLQQFLQVQRLPGTELCERPDWLEEAERLVEQEEQEERDASTRPLIDPNTPQREWTPRMPTDLAHAVFTDHVLTLISLPSKCGLRWEQHAILISLIDGGNLDLALDRLKQHENIYASIKWALDVTLADEVFSRIKDCCARTLIYVTMRI